jgi:hypothetical protein
MIDGRHRIFVPIGKSNAKGAKWRGPQMVANIANHNWEPTLHSCQVNKPATLILPRLQFRQNR